MGKLPSWGDDVFSSSTTEDKPDSPYTGWLGGLIKSDIEPLTRPEGADSFSETGNWLAGLIQTPSDFDKPEPAAATLRKREESRTNEVDLGSMLQKAREVEESSPRHGPASEMVLAPPADKPAWLEPEPKTEPKPARAILAPLAASPVIEADESAPVPLWAQPDPSPPEILGRIKPSTRPAPEKPKPSPKVEQVTSAPRKQTLAQAWSAALQRQRVSFYRSLTTMLAAGMPMFSVFEFLARQSESLEHRDACRRISQDLVAGYPLHRAAHKEPLLFSDMGAKLIEVGVRTGKLVPVLQRLAIDEEQRWKLRQTLQSHLFYPVCIASLTLVAVVLLPPFVLADLLNQVVALTAEPPALTKAILAFSSALSSPPFLIFAALLAVGLGMLVKSSGVRSKVLEMEPLAWELPGVGGLIQAAVSLRFLRVFTMTYDVGLSAPQCLVLASEATGSRKATLAGPRMKELLIDGGTLRECLEHGDFLPRLVIEAVEAGQQSGDVTGMMESVARIVDSELEYRIETLMAMIEPLFMAALGIFVGVFAIGCLLPILKLSETL